MADNLSDDAIKQAVLAARGPSNLVTEADVEQPSIAQTIYDIGAAIPSAVSRYVSSVPERFSAATERVSQMSPTEIAQSLGSTAKTMIVDPAVQAFTAPARAYRGEISQEQMLPEALNFTGMTTLGGIPASALERSGGMMLGTSGTRMLPETAAVELAKRQLSPVGLYSHGAEAAMSLPQATGSVDQMIAMLRKQSGVTEAELRNAGILTSEGQVNPEWLSRGKIGREDIASHLQSRMPQVEETVLGSQGNLEAIRNVKKEFFDKLTLEKAKENAVYSGDIDHIRDWNNASDEIKNWHLSESAKQLQIDYHNNPDVFDEKINSMLPPNTETKYHQYTLPGGENYREVLLRLPNAGDGGATDWVPGLGRVTQPHPDAQQAPAFRSPHWDDPNVLAHIRMADRTGPNGEKILHVEEVQSDWGQKGKKEGFYDPKQQDQWAKEHQKLQSQLEDIRKKRAIKEQMLEEHVLDTLGPEPILSFGGDERQWEQYSAARRNVFESDEELKKIKENQNNIVKAIEDSIRSKPSSRVSTAPYVTSTQGWTDLALKRILKEAAEGGYDKVVWTPGVEQAGRYNLRNQIDELMVTKNNNGTFSLSATLPGGGVHKIGAEIPSEKLPDYVGKEMSEKIRNQEFKSDVYNADDLEVGGEGMKEYYDNILPKRFNAVAQKHDKTAKVKYTDVMLPPSGKRGTNNPPIQAPGLDITPQMRESILKGQGAFMDGGRVGYAGKGKVKEDDTVRSALDIARQYEDPANRIDADIRALTQNLSGLDISSAFPAFHTGLPQRPQVGGAGLVPSKPSNNPDLFDFSRLSEVPKVQQFDLPRYQPARGVPARVTEMMANPDVRNAVLQTISEGVQKGGAKWYNADPLRDKFIEKLGADAGDAAFRKYMDLVAATSPRSDVGTNVRNASYYYQRAMSGQPMPEVGEKNPQPYGHMAQKLHQMNAQRVAGEGWDPLQNPKPASFVENLVGNQAPVTVDTHAYRLPAILARDPRFLEISFKPEKDVPPMNIQKMVESGKIPFEEAVKRPAYWQSQPKENEYGAMEQYYKSLGKELGLTPAQTQAAAWVGGGKITGLQSDESKPFLQFFQDRIFKTAAETGMDPKDVLDKFIKGEATLRAEGGRTTENNAVGNAIRAARDHFDFGGDVRGGDSPFMSRSDYGLRSAPTPSFREAEDRSMREYNRATESGWSPTGGGSDRSQSPLEDTLTGRSQGFEGAPPVNMPSNIGELLGYNRARQSMLQQQRQQQSAEHEAENQRIKDALAMASVGQTSFDQTGILPSGFPPVAKQPVYWGGTPPDLPQSTIDRALQLSQMPNVMRLPAGTTLGRTEMPLQAEMAGAPQESFEQSLARDPFGPNINAQFAMAGSPYAVTPSAPTTMIAGLNRPAFPHSPTPPQATQASIQPDVSAPFVQPNRPITLTPQTAQQQVAQNVPLPPNVVRDAVVAASSPPVVVASAPQPVVDAAASDQDALVLGGRKTFELPKNAPMPMPRPSDVRESNPIAAIIDSIKSDLARQEGERINALEAAGKTATYPGYSTASDPLAAQRAYLTDIGLDPNNPADMAKVKARIIQQDGQDKVDYYTKSLGEALFGAPSEEQKVAAALNVAGGGGGGDRAPVQQTATQAATVTPPPYMTELSEGNLALPHPEGLSAQQWANKYAGGDINKVHARIKFINGAPTLEYYTV